MKIFGTGRLVGLVLTLASIIAVTDTSAQGESEDVNLTPAVYWISDQESLVIGQRFLDAINGSRAMIGLEPLAYSPNLNFAAFIHAADLSFQGKTWNYGSDGSSPLTRAEKAGYEGVVLAENVVQSFDPPLVLLSGWLQDERSSSNILDRSARHAGLGWYQNDEGRTWWVLLTGR